MKKALVTGAGGFIGHNLVKRLKSEGWWVKGMDLKKPLYEPTLADEFDVVDVREVRLEGGYERIYHLAADMGGAGFVFTGDNDADIFSNSLALTLNVAKEASRVGCGTLFYSSSVCVYPDAVSGKEIDAYPGNPPSNYGWEKLTGERILASYARNYGINVRVARFHNCFGPYGTYDGGREKSPAAICRKVFMADKEIEIWGDGEQLRPFIFIDDLLDGIERLMQSDFKDPINLGPSEGVTINQMVDMVSDIAGKKLEKKYVAGPTGGQIRRANNDLAQEKLGWRPTRDLRESLEKTYLWISQEIERTRSN